VTVPYWGLAPDVAPLALGVAGVAGQSLSWSRSQKSGHVHSADSAVQGASALDVADREAISTWGVDSISIFGS
jgi:hypothetical protein